MDLNALIDPSIEINHISFRVREEIWIPRLPIRAFVVVRNPCFRRGWRYRSGHRTRWRDCLGGRWSHCFSLGGCQTWRKSKCRRSRSVDQNRTTNIGRITQQVSKVVTFVPTFTPIVPILPKSTHEVAPLALRRTIKSRNFLRMDGAVVDVDDLNYLERPTRIQRPV